MPHNRSDRERRVEEKYEFVVFDGEFSLFNGALAIVDAIVTGGTFTVEYLKSTLGEFGEKVVREMIDAGLNPANETLYGDVMVFQNWERPIPGGPRI